MQTKVSHLAKVVMRVESAAEASMLGVVSQAEKWLASQGPQRFDGSMPAAVQPVAAADRPTAALPLSAGP